jgi:two-component sensor histidine kinase
MAASVGHELNNYLTALSGSLQLMRAGDGAMSSEERVAHLEKAAEQVRRMAGLSKGLMDFSHLQSRPMPVDLGALVTELVEFLSPQNRFDLIDVEFDKDPAVGIVVLDPAQIQQVLMNLLYNAADAIREAGPAGGRIDVWLRRDAASDRLIELGVADTGTGVPDALKERIFEPTVTTKPKGNGFGLSTVYRIVRNHGGDITVEDGRPGGAVFRVTLPARPGEEQPLVAGLRVAAEAANADDHPGDQRAGTGGEAGRPQRRDTRSGHHQRGGAEGGDQQRQVRRLGRRHAPGDDQVAGHRRPQDDQGEQETAARGRHQRLEEQRQRPEHHGDVTQSSHRVENSERSGQ